MSNVITIQKDNLVRYGVIAGFVILAITCLTLNTMRVNRADEVAFYQFKAESYLNLIHSIMTASAKSGNVETSYMLGSTLNGINNSAQLLGKPAEFDKTSFNYQEKPDTNIVQEK